MNMRFIYCQTLPDVNGARALYQLDDTISDKHVAKIIFHHHTQERGRDSRYLAPFQAMLSVVGVFEIRDFETRLDMLHIDERSEMELLAAIAPRLDGQSVICWDGGHNLEALLKSRALVHAEPLQNLQLQPIESTLSLSPGEIHLDQLAGSLGIPAQPSISDESAWDIYRNKGIEPLIQSCRSNLRATILIGLRQQWLAGHIDESDYEELGQACHSLLGQPQV